MPNTSIRKFDLSRINHKFGGSVYEACQNWFGVQVSAQPIPGVDTDYGTPGRPRGLTAYRRGYGRRSRPTLWRQHMLTEDEYNLVLAVQEVIEHKTKRLPSIPVVLGTISRLAVGAHAIVIPPKLTRDEQRAELLKHCYTGPVPMLTPRSDDGDWVLSVECATMLNEWCRENAPHLYEENVYYVEEMPK